MEWIFSAFILNMSPKADNGKHRSYILEKSPVMSQPGNPQSPENHPDFHRQEASVWSEIHLYKDIVENMQVCLFDPPLFAVKVFPLLDGCAGVAFENIVELNSEG